MRRALLLAALLALGALACAEPAAAPDPLAGHEVMAAMPDMVLVVADNAAGVTWTAPLVISVDGRATLSVELPKASAPLPRPPWWRLPVIIAGSAIAGIAAGLLLH